MNYQILSETKKFLKKSHKHMINGKWHDSANEEILNVINPATKENISLVQLAGEEDVNIACQLSDINTDKYHANQHS